MIKRGGVFEIAPSEEEFQRAVMAYARAHGWAVWHFHDSRRQAGKRFVGDRDAAGFPDLVLARERIVYAELKGAAGRLTARQEHALTLLAVAGGEVYVWRPADWPEIERILGGRA
jgi:hypothetical protein